MPLSWRCECNEEKVRWKIRRTGICLASVLFLTSVPVCVRAEEASSDYVQGYETEENSLKLYIERDSLQKMEQMTSLNRKKCPVILSDGEDDQKTGFTKDEAYEAIKNSSIPVYTLAALPVQYSKEQNEFGKELGSFARMSAGGQDFMPVEDGTDGTYVGNGIVEDMRQGLILTLDISDAAKQAGQKDDLIGPEQENPEPDSESEPNPEPEPDPEPVLHPVDFAAIRYAEVNFSLELEENRIYMLGHDSRAELILTPEDKKLSGIHCKVRWRNGTLDIWDAESTNGTFVNGVSIRKLDMATVENG